MQRRIGLAVVYVLLIGIVLLVVWNYVPNRIVDNDRDIIQWKLSLKESRPSHGLAGPLPQSCLPEQTLREFGLPTKHNTRTSGSTYPSQTGEHIFKLLKFSGTSPIWTIEMWSWYMSQPDTSVPDYPHSVEDLKIAYAKAPAGRVRRGAVAVFSSITPWAEASLHRFGAKSITSVDYNTAIVHAEIPVTTLSFQQISQADRVIQFDSIVSFSGIEHDGLGRYGDPINPDGDLSAMSELWNLLKPGGILFLGIPIARQDKLIFPYHRIYGPDRLQRLIRKFTLKGFVWDGLYHATAETLHNVDDRVLDWQYQPVLILQKQ